MRIFITKEIAKKTLIAVLILSIVFGNFGFIGLGVKEARANVTSAYTSIGSNAAVDDLESVALAVGTSVLQCATEQLGVALGDLVLGALTDMLGSLVQTVTGGLMDLEVPVKDAQMREKETMDLVTFKPSLDGIAHCMIEIMLGQVLRDLTVWIKEGAHGSPLFLENPSAFFSQMADEQFGEALNELIGADLCSSFSLQIKANLLFNWAAPPVENKCTLSEIIAENNLGNIDVDVSLGEYRGTGDNAEDFLRGDWYKGGLKGWYTVSQLENPWKIAGDVQNEAEKMVKTDLNNMKMELSWSDGIMSFKGEDGRVVSPGVFIMQKIENMTGIPYDRIALSDEITELVMAISDFFVKKAFEWSGELTGQDIYI